MTFPSEKHSLLQQRTPQTRQFCHPPCSGCNPHAIQLLLLVFSVLCFAAYSTVFGYFPFAVQHNRSRINTSFCWNWTNVEKNFDIHCPFWILGVGCALSGINLLGLILSLVVQTVCKSCCIELDQRPCCRITRSYIGFALSLLSCIAVVAFVVLVAIISATWDKETCFMRTGNIIKDQACRLWFIVLLAGILVNIAESSVRGCTSCRKKRLETFDNTRHGDSVLYQSINYSDIG